jgi:hypothetical protein
VSRTVNKCGHEGYYVVLHIRLALQIERKTRDLELKFMVPRVYSSAHANYTSAGIAERKDVIG